MWEWCPHLVGIVSELCRDVAGIVSDIFRDRFGIVLESCRNLQGPSVIQDAVVGGFALKVDTPRRTFSSDFQAC